jgi:hypothetical protein
LRLVSLDSSGGAASTGAPPRELVLAAGGFVVAVGIALRAQFMDPSGAAGLGDPLFTMWRLAWVAHQVRADPAHLFDANIFYPERGTLTYSDAILLPALLAAPLLWIGVPVAYAHAILIVCAFIASGLAVYALARAFGIPAAAAWIGGLVFAMYPYRFAHYNHLELQMTHWMPLALLAGHRLLTTGKLRYAAFLTAVLAAQWYSCLYYGVFLSIFASVFLIVLAAARSDGWRRLFAAIGAVALAVLAAFPLARAYKATEVARGIRSVASIQSYSARAIEYLQPHHTSLFYGGVDITPRVPERTALFPNVTPIALAVSGVVSPPMAAYRLACVLAGAIAFDGSRGMNGWWYPLAYHHVDVFKSMRVPARFAILVGLALSLLSAAGAAQLIRMGRNRRAQIAIATTLTVVCFVEGLPRLELTSAWHRPPPLYGHLRGKPNAVLFEYPVFNDFEQNIPYMYFSTWHWKPMVNGYSGNLPKSYEALIAATADFPSVTSVSYLDRVGVTHVGLHCALWKPEPCALTRDRLNAHPRFRLLVSAMWEEEPALLFELVR